MTYYLKYRPQKLEDLDLESVRDSLQKLVKYGNIPHAFLFSGPKGTGKTSAARILAKIVNCDPPSSRRTPGLRKGKKPEKNRVEPCNKCEQCKSISAGNNIDVIELDAASNRGIDDIRTLRDAVKLAPARAKKKVYIVDEAHMLTTEASNALLKTLEEPPSHVIFILATTNPEKLIETIRSRTVNIVFNRATIEEIVRSLTKVVKMEKINISKESLAVIAKASMGSFRDAVKILEQLVQEKKPLEAVKIEEYLSKIGRGGVENFLDILAVKNTKNTLEEIEKIITSGTSAGIFLEEILTRLRESILSKLGVGDGKDLLAFGKEDTIYLIELFSKAAKETPMAPIEQLPLELAVITWSEKGEKQVEDDFKKEKISIEKGESVSVVTKGVKVNKTGTISKVTDEVWKVILEQIKLVNTSIEALLRAARPLEFDGKTLTLGVYYRFHKERLEENGHRRILEDVVATVLGNPVRVVCTLTEPPIKKTVEESGKIQDALTANTPRVKIANESDSILTEGEDKDIIRVAEDIFGN